MLQCQNLLGFSHSGRPSVPRHFPDILPPHLIEPNPKEGEPRTWKAGAVFMAIPPRLVLPPLISWEPSLPTELAEAAKATPTWMGETTKVCKFNMFERRGEAWL